MKNIKIIFMDVDGTLTDGKIHISENGELFKTFNIKDGMAITLLKKMIRPQWRIYREVLRLGFLRSAFYMLCWALNGVRKYNSIKLR